MSSCEFKEILSIIYYWLPKTVRDFISPVVEPAFFFIKQVLLVASQIRLPVYMLQGKEKSGRGSLTTLFWGDERLLHYFSDLLYFEEPAKESLGNVFIWKTKLKPNLNIPETDLIFIGIDKFFSRFLSRQGFTIIPQWLLFIFDLSKPLPKVWKLSQNKSLREDLRIIRKHKYSYEMTCDPAKFEYFYHQMHLPYIAGRFGKSMIPSGFRGIRRIFEKGQLLLVKRGNEYLSGNLIYTHNKRAFAACTGVREGNIEYVKQGALSACYYFSILWAKERGYKWFDFGHCRPFLNDGVFRYKKKWCMEIKRSERHRAVFGMKTCNLQQGALDALANNPFIFIDQDKLKALILAKQEHPLTLGEVQSLFKTYYIPGVDCLVVVSPQGFTQQAEEFATSPSTHRLRLMSMKPDIFLKRFPHIAWEIVMVQQTKK